MYSHRLLQSHTPRSPPAKQFSAIFFFCFVFVFVCFCFVFTCTNKFSWSSKVLSSKNQETAAAQERLGQGGRRHRFRGHRGETLGVIGESGCGKTTTSKLILLQETPTAGAIRFDGEDIAELRRAGADALPARGAGRVPGPVQLALPAHAGRRDHRRAVADPYRHVAPRQQAERVGRGARARRACVRKWRGSSRTSSAAGSASAIAIARALVTNTRLIVLDEPVSALDVSIRAQIMNQLEELQEPLGVSYLFIGHDLATVAHISHRIAVMYLGQIVELADSLELCDKPLHPYTQALFTAALPAHPDDQHEKLTITGEVPSALDPPSGCRFHPRCPHAMPQCAVARRRCARKSPRSTSSPATYIEKFDNLHGRSVQVALDMRGLISPGGCDGRARVARPDRGGQGRPRLAARLCAPHGRVGRDGAAGEPASGAGRVR